MTPLLFLAIDDSPGRYDDFVRLLDTDFSREFDDRHRLVVTHDGVLSRQLAMIADVILLDHDMPGEDGRSRARWIAWAQPRTAVIITSTTGLEGVREEMRDILTAAGIPVLLCPADHHGCEVEWVRWAEGVAARRPGARFLLLDCATYDIQVKQGENMQTPFVHLIGHPVLVRSRGSGVWAATLDAAHVTAAGVIVNLSGARRLWSWRGAGECSSLALTGPSDGKIGPACSVIVAEVVEVHPMQPAAVSAVAKVQPWTK